MEKPKLEKSISFTHAHVYPCRYRNLKNLPHWHKEHELVFVQTGQAEIMYNGEVHQLAAGDSAFLHSNGIHSINAIPGAVLIVAKIDENFLATVIDTAHLCSPVLRQDYAIDAVFEDLSKELVQNDRYSGMIADSITIRLIALIFRGEAVEEKTAFLDGTDKKNKLLLDLIASHYADITFDEAAKFMHFSRPYFSKYFNQHIGMTFTRYLNLVKVSRAIQFLSEGRMTMAEISQACGFNTIRNFNRVFKAVTGYSPNTLPAEEQVTYQSKERTDIGFDPTLSCTEIIPLQAE